jgi:hypothetical protein
MKKIGIAIVFVIFFIACKEQKKVTPEPQKESTAYLSFGEKITDEGAVSKELMAKEFETLQLGDTVNIKFSSKINEVCKSKGCWMKLDLGNQKESMVRFTDYGFFMPLDSDNKEVVVEGRAYVTEISIKEQQHYAEDAGKTEEEISKITAPKFTYAFEADGVLMKR